MCQRGRGILGILVGSRGERPVREGRSSARDAWRACHGCYSLAAGSQEKDVVLSETIGIPGGNLCEGIRHPPDLIAAATGRAEDNAGVGCLTPQGVLRNRDEVPNVSRHQAAATLGRILELGPVGQVPVSCVHRGLHVEAAAAEGAGNRSRSCVTSENVRRMRFAIRSIWLRSRGPSRSVVVGVAIGLLRFVCDAL